MRRSLPPGGSLELCTPPSASDTRFTRHRADGRRALCCWGWLSALPPQPTWAQLCWAPLWRFFFCCYSLPLVPCLPLHTFILCTFLLSSFFFWCDMCVWYPPI